MYILSLLICNLLVTFSLKYMLQHIWEREIQHYCLPFANERLVFKNVIEFQYVWDILLFLLEKLSKNGLQWKAKCLIFHMKAHLLLQRWSYKTWLKTDLV